MAIDARRRQARQVVPRPRVVQFSLTEEEFAEVSVAARRCGLARGAFAAEATAYGPDNPWYRRATASGSGDRLHRGRGDHLGCACNGRRTRVQGAGYLYDLAHLRLQSLTRDFHRHVGDLVREQKMSALLR